MTSETIRLRRERLAAQLFMLGARPLLEALVEVSNGRDLDDVLARYGRLDPGVVRALGGDRWPASPIRVVGR